MLTYINRQFNSQTVNLIDANIYIQRFTRFTPCPLIIHGPQANFTSQHSSTISIQRRLVFASDIYPVSIALTVNFCIRAYSIAVNCEVSRRLIHPRAPWHEAKLFTWKHEISENLSPRTEFFFALFAWRIRLRFQLTANYSSTYLYIYY